MKPNEIHNKRILFSPLNWGMGHVSRSIYLLYQLQQNGNELVIACSVDQQRIYEEYLSDVSYIAHPGYPFKFGGKGNFGWDLLKEVGPLQKRLNDELKEVDQYLEDERIDIVISDHRYGFRSKKVPSVFITHQYNLPTKWYEKGVDLLHKKLMGKFDQIWILDFSDSRLAGALSKTNDPKAIYIGTYSRFQLYELPERRTGSVLIASGPEVYAQQLIDLYRDEQLTVICNKGFKLGKDQRRKGDTWREKDEVIMQAAKIISRAGYSTIMDLEVLNTASELIPTPGQAEQIYLAKKYGA